MKPDLYPTEHTKTNRLIFLFIGTLAFVYILIRAVTLGFTYDEVWTIDWFVPLPVMEIVNYTPASSNNHMLNTLLIKLMFIIGGESEFVARIPNVLGGLMFITFAYKITSRHLKPFIGICAFLLLLLNPFLLDFFSLARGYGLALGFQMWSLCYLVLFVRERRQRYASISLIAATLAVLSNWALMNYWIVLFGIVTALPFLFRNLYPQKKQVAFNFVTALTLLALAYEPIRKLMDKGELYYGGENGLYDDTFTSLTKYTFYSHFETPAMMLALDCFLVIFLLIVLAAFYFNRIFHTPKNVLLALLALSITSVVVQHYVLDTLYILDRTALYLVPITFLILCFSVNEFSVKWVPKVVMVTVVAAFGLNFFARANFYKTTLWSFDSHTEEILETLNEQGKRTNDTLKVEISWVFASTFGYYSSRNKYPYIQFVHKETDTSRVFVDYLVNLEHGLPKSGYNPFSPKMRYPLHYKWKEYPEEQVIIYRVFTDSVTEPN